MTLTASGPTYRNGVEGGFNFALNTPEDVYKLVNLLGEDGVFTAMVTGEQGVLEAHVQHGFGYLAYFGADATGDCSVGDPSSPEVTDSEEGFPAGSGVPLDMFTAALIEFLNTDRMPRNIRWSDEAHHPTPA